MGKNMYEKIRESHVLPNVPGDAPLLFVDRHLMHEVTSPQAFEGIRANNRKIRHPELIVATVDHCIPTKNRDKPIADPIARKQVETLAQNCMEFDVTLYGTESFNQGVIHVMAPELGYIQPGMVVVCGDSHTATHGAFGALAFGIGTSEVEHVLATQTLQQTKSKTMLIKTAGKLFPGVTAKDLALAVIGMIGTAGGTGYVIEFQGEAIRDLTMEGRMTLCNMAIEGGARAGMVEPDEKTFDYLKERANTPKGAEWESALTYWKSLPSDSDAEFDLTVTLDADKITPQVTWGTSPEQVVGIDSVVPSPDDFTDQVKKQACQKALEYMDIKAGVPITSISVDYAFIGSCTNGRIEDLREAAKVAKGKKVNPSVTALVVPGSGPVKKQAEEEGLDQIFMQAGFEWRDPGCSMCLAMNDDVLEPGQRCASTSNRNFEGRQGKGSRTHLVSPAMAAAAAIAGHFVDVRSL